MTMDNFNLKRFGKVFCYDLRVERTFMLKVFFGLLFVMTFFMIVSMIPVIHDKRGEIVSAFYMMNLFIYSSFSLYVFIGGCMIFRHLKTRQDNISYLMLPGTNLEKFLSRFIYATALWIFMFAAAYVCADLLRMLFLFLMGGTCVEWGVPQFFHVQRFFFEKMSDPALTNFSDMLSFTSGVQAGAHEHVAANQYSLAQLFSEFMANKPLISVGCFVVQCIIGVSSHAVCVLCGSLFRRLSWLFGLILMYVGSWFMLLFGLHTLTLQIVIGAVYAAFLVFCYVAAYKVFCRRPAISNKLINI
jgi:hypothetical protein